MWDLFEYVDHIRIYLYLLRNLFHRSALQLLQFCKEHHRNRFKHEIQSIEDALITKVLEDDVNSSDGKELDLGIFTLIEHINDVRTMSRTVLKYVRQISDDEIASHLIRAVLLHSKVNELPMHEIEIFRKYLNDITLFAKIGRATAITELLPCDTWSKVLGMNDADPGRLLFSLIERSQYKICYQWLQTSPSPLQNIAIKAQFVDLFMGKIQDAENTQNQDFIKVCQILLKILVLQMDSKLLLKLKNQQLLQYLVDYLIENSTNEIYANYKITLIIFEMIEPNERDTFWDLVEKPLLIIEQYIINSKFEKLSKILKAIRPNLKCNECSICKKAIGSDGATECDSNIDWNKDHTISNKCIDHILQVYAAKALDFQMCSEIMIASSTLERSVSLDSLCGTFIMPREAPDKSNWVSCVESSGSVGTEKLPPMMATLSILFDH